MKRTLMGVLLIQILGLSVASCRGSNSKLNEDVADQNPFSVILSNGTESQQCGDDSHASSTGEPSSSALALDDPDKICTGVSGSIFKMENGKPTSGVKMKLFIGRSSDPKEAIKTVTSSDSGEYSISIEETAPLPRAKLVLYLLDDAGNVYKQTDLKTGTSLTNFNLGVNFVQKKPVLGISVNVNPSKGYNSGVTIIKLVADSPADIAGLRVNDLVRTINGKTISSTKDFEDAIDASGKKASIEIERDATATQKGRDLKIDITLNK